jgi:hypothetical protein
MSAASQPDQLRPLVAVIISATSAGECGRASQAWIRRVIEPNGLDRWRHRTKPLPIAYLFDLLTWWVKWLI